MTADLFPAPNDGVVPPTTQESDAPDADNSGQTLDRNEPEGEEGQSHPSAIAPDAPAPHPAKTAVGAASAPPQSDTRQPDDEASLPSVSQLYWFERDVDQKIERYRRSGKDPHDLFDPSKPDYLGTPEALAPYVSDWETRNARSTTNGPSVVTIEAAVPTDTDGEGISPDPPQPQSPSLAERLTDGLKAALSSAGISPRVAAPLAEGIASAAALHPAISIPLAADEIHQAISKRDPLDLLLAAASFVPGGRLARSAIRNYRRTFFSAYPHLEGQVWVHHAVPQVVLKKYPGVMTEDEIHAIENLRGIPNQINRSVHLGTLQREWRQFIENNKSPTKELLLKKAEELDTKYGNLFRPERGAKR